MKHFKFLTGDMNWADYGGKWYRELEDHGYGNLPTYHVIELFNWREDVDSTYSYKYNVSLSEVTFIKIPLTVILSAKRSYGMELNKTERYYRCFEKFPVFPGNWPKVLTDDKLHLLDVLHGYGAKAPLWDDSGNNFKKLLSAAKQYSRELEEDPYEHHKAMQKPVNRMGSTAEEYMCGDIYSAMIREKDTPVGRLMLKLHGVEIEGEIQ